MNFTPQWLKKRIVVNEEFFNTKKALSDLSVDTVCESSRCPNLNECFSRKFVTFMILGSVCTRTCAFCSVDKGNTSPVDCQEPARIRDCVSRLGLKYVIITSVTRDDLADGGAGQFVKVVECIKHGLRNVVIELLIPDFAGNADSVKTVALSGADIIGHNIETIRRLYPAVRNGAGYSRSLGILKSIKEISPGTLTKSAILVGLGEKEEEVVEAMRDLRNADCDILTIGQYLRPSQNHYPAARFVTPEEFQRFIKHGKDMGFKNMSAGPFVRSSYMAEENFKEVSHDKCYSAAVSARR